MQIKSKRQILLVESTNILQIVSIIILFNYIITLFNLALQKVIQSIKMVPSGIKIGKEQLNVLAYADDIALIGKNDIEIRKLFVEMENIARKYGLQINHEKTKCMIVERKNNLKKNKI